MNSGCLPRSRATVLTWEEPSDVTTSRGSIPHAQHFVFRIPVAELRLESCTCLRPGLTGATPSEFARFRSSGAPDSRNSRTARRARASAPNRRQAQGESPRTARGPPRQPPERQRADSGRMGSHDMWGRQARAAAGTSRAGSRGGLAARGRAPAAGRLAHDPFGWERGRGRGRRRRRDSGRAGRDRAQGPARPRRVLRRRTRRHVPGGVAMVDRQPQHARPAAWPPQLSTT